MMASRIKGKPKPSGDIGVRRIIVINFAILIALLGSWFFYCWWTLDGLEDRTEKTFYIKTPHRIGLQQCDFLIQDLRTILTSIKENLQITNLDQTIAILRLKMSELDQISDFSIEENAIEGTGEGSYTVTWESKLANGEVGRAKATNTRIK